MLLLCTLYDCVKFYLEHDVVLVDLTIVGEAAQRGDGLGGQICSDSDIGDEVKC